MGDVAHVPKPPEQAPARPSAPEPAEQAVVRPTLVVGWGSELRGDDAAGRAVAAAVGARSLAGVDVVAVHQLTPEVAAMLAGRRHVIFVDAAVDVATVTVEPLRGEPGRPASHHAAPTALLALAGRLGWEPPRATLVRVPARNFDIGVRMSAVAEAGVHAAADEVARVCAADAGLPDPRGDARGQRAGD